MTGGQHGFSEEDRGLLAQAAAWEQCPELGDCAPTRLSGIARERGLEFATVLLYDRVLRHPGHSAFLRRVQSCVERATIQPTLIGIIPGAFYLQHKNTGADGARLSTLVTGMNCSVERVPVESFGSLTKNASLIADWLLTRQHQRVVLVSLSKGSADLKVALGLPDTGKFFRNVVAWISISGLPQGTPLVAWLRRQPLRKLGVRLVLRLRGQRYSVVEELRSEADGPLANWPSLPTHLRVIHIVGFPLRRHLAHPWAPRAYERLAPLGPNDGGGFLLADVLKLPGTVFPVWGADHYLQPAWDATPFLRRALVEAMAP